LSHDVNEKTIDFVMAGVASVVGRLSRYTVLEAIVQFDSNYVKKWLVNIELSQHIKRSGKYYSFIDCR